MGLHRHYGHASKMKETNRLAREAVDAIKETDRLAKQSQYIQLAQYLGKSELLDVIKKR